MKVSITGHTNGLGLALKNVLDSMIGESNTIGFSLSTGYDISNPADRERIFEESKDCDVFINNAFHQTGQLELLKLFSERWNGLNKKIINIGSTIIFVDQNRIKFPFLKEYSSAKILQDDFCRNNLLTLYPTIVSVIPGAMETRMTDHPGATIYKMKVDEVADLIWRQVLNSPSILPRYVVIGHPMEATNYDSIVGD